MCPKHDLELEDAAARLDRGPAPHKGEEWVEVACYADSLRAEAPRIRLEAEGIPTFLDGERMGQPSMYRVAIGGVKLCVPGSLAADARVLLAQSWAPVAVADDDLDDAWDDLAPEPSAGWSDLAGWVLIGGEITVLIVTVVLWLLCFRRG
jgi:hypothetical protein